jgi:DNA-directed RNA polymerase specialized sigma24 family protein
MRIRELIDRCSQNEGEAWAELWQIVEDTVLRPLRRLLTSYHLDLSLADDVLQEFYKYLQDDNLRRLQLFRGASEVEFKAFLRTIAVRFTLKLLRKWQRRRQRENTAIRFAARPTRWTLTEPQEKAALSELLSVMTDGDRRKLCTILGSEWSAKAEPEGSSTCHSPSARTVRHWQHELIRKYFKYFGEES